MIEDCFFIENILTSSVQATALHYQLF